MSDSTNDIHETPSSKPCNLRFQFFEACLHFTWAYIHNPVSCELPTPRLPSPHNHAHCKRLTELILIQDSAATVVANNHLKVCPDSKTLPCQIMEAEVNYRPCQCPKCQHTLALGQPVDLVGQRESWKALANDYEQIWIDSYFHPRRAARRTEWMAKWERYSRAQTRHSIAEPDILYNPADRRGFFTDIQVETLAQDDRNCSICYEDMANEVAKIPCGHRFHFKCIEDWFHGTNLDKEIKASCPLCRKNWKEALIRIPSWDDPVYGPAEGVEDVPEMRSRRQIGGYVPWPPRRGEGAIPQLIGFWDEEDEVEYPGQVVEVEEDFDASEENRDEEEERHQNDPDSESNPQIGSPAAETSFTQGQLLHGHSETPHPSTRSDIEEILPSEIVMGDSPPLEAYNGPDPGPPMYAHWSLD